MNERANLQCRRSIRLRGYDYAWPGAYFITICTQTWLCLFGKIAGRQMALNAAGQMIQNVWDQIPIHYPAIGIDQFVIMPNHVHGIIVLGAGPRACPPQPGQPQGVAPTRLSLPDVVLRFKTMTTKLYTDGVKLQGWQPFPGKLWQRNYWEHIVRNDTELKQIREYIQNNPAKWDLDRLYVASQYHQSPASP